MTLRRTEVRRCTLKRAPLLVPIMTLAALLTGCRQDMQDQPKYIALRPSGP
jgi:hypothetical protein